MSSVKGAPPLRASLRDLPSPPEGRIGWPWTEETPPVAEVRPDGAAWPTISIVTPVHDRALDLEETLRSVLLQGYPRLEYVIVNDGSTDGSAEIISRYDPWLAQCVTQEHRGLPEAINRGFEHATGDVFAYLTPDAVLRPGALAAAAREVDPGRGQHIAMGRCSFIDATGRFIGVEHPSQFVSNERVLAVWKGQTIPQPSVFWAREVWRSCGPIGVGSAVDYDLCCRFASRYRFHFVDQVLSSYRLHSDPTGPGHGQRGGLDETVRISRRYWGRPWTPRYWRLAASLAAFRFHRRGRGLARLRRFGEELRQRRPAKALLHGALALLLAPEVVFTCLVYPGLPLRLKRALDRLSDTGEEAPETLAYLENTDAWPDGWVGPRLIVKVSAPAATHALAVSGFLQARYLGGRVMLTVLVDGDPAGQVELGGEPPLFEVTLPLPAALAEGMHIVEIKTGAYFVPHRVLGNGDRRPLCWQLVSLHFVA